MKLKRDISIGFLNSLWSAGIGLACVPVYIHYLGIEAYGIVGFFVATQGLLQLLDMGLSPTINREVARYSAMAMPAGAGNLLHTLSFVYWGLAIAIGVAMYFLAGPIAANWLQSRSLPRQTIEHSVMLLGLVIACRWPIGLYQGVLLGSLRINVSSGINILMVSLANGGAILVLANVSATLEAFFVWQAVVGLLYAIVMRHAAWRALAGPAAPRFDAAELRRVARFAIGMSGIALSGIVLTQLDKVILSRLLPLDDFGRYALAGAVASGLYLILTPTFNIIYPRMSALVVKCDEPALIEFYRTGSRLLSAALFPAAATAAFFSAELLLLWTRDPQLAASAAPIASLFIIGTALNGCMHFPYSLQLAFGTTRLPLTINATLIVVMVPLTVLLALRFGAVGGAMAWVMLNFLYVVVGTWLTHRTLLRGLGMTWLMIDIAAPAALATATICLVGYEIRKLGLPAGGTFLLACMLAATCSVCLLLLTKRTRSTLRFIRSMPR